MRSGDNMRLDDRTVKQYFQDMEAFVTCVETMYPQHFNVNHDVMSRLDKVCTRDDS